MRIKVLITFFQDCFLCQSLMFSPCLTFLVLLQSYDFLALISQLQFQPHKTNAEEKYADEGYTNTGYGKSRKTAARSITRHGEAQS